MAQTDALKIVSLLLVASISIDAFHIPCFQKKQSSASTEGNIEPLPLVVWHGLGDSYDADGLNSIGELLNETNPDTYTYYIRIDDDGSADRKATFLGNITEQVLKVCEDLANHPILSKAPAINGLGLSQGGQFLRAYVERCNFPRVANLVTMGSQHNGISEFQTCGTGDWLCQLWEGFLKGKTWTDLAQSTLVPAQYYRDPEEMDEYLENSNFLADVNNEREVKNTTYKENMKKLDMFAMYMFSDDVTVVPKESSHWNEVNATSGEVTKLQDLPIYLEDWLGLRWLDEKGRLESRIAEGGHMQITEETFVEIFERYFRPKPEGESRKATGFVGKLQKLLYHGVKSAPGELRRRK